MQQSHEIFIQFLRTRGSTNRRKAPGSVVGNSILCMADLPTLILKYVTRIGAQLSKFISLDCTKAYDGSLQFSLGTSPSMLHSSYTRSTFNTNHGSSGGSAQ